MRRLFVTDIHGGYKALVQCVQRSGFNKDKDILIVGGDIVDGWPESYEVVKYLSKVRHLVLILGNHDKWFIDHLKTGVTPQIWTGQGGRATLKSFMFREASAIKLALDLFEKAHRYWISPDNKLFVHGGFDPDKPIEEQSEHDLIWNRSLLDYAKQCSLTKGCDIPKKLQIFDEIYIGHTTTFHYSDIPIKYCNVWALDQGGGYEGKLSIIDVDTKEFWQSKKLDSLYNCHNERNLRKWS